MLPRPLTPTDAAAYVALRREMLADSPWSFTSSPDADRGCNEAGMAASLAGPDFTVVGAFDDYRPATTGAADDHRLATVAGARLVAVAGLNRERSQKRRHIAWLWGVYTTPARRSRGLGRAVVVATLDIARTWTDLAAVYLGVSENAPAARALYESLGFQPWGVEPDAIRTDGKSYSETHMRLDL